MFPVLIVHGQPHLFVDVSRRCLDGQPGRFVRFELPGKPQPSAMVSLNIPVRFCDDLGFFGQFFYPREPLVIFLYHLLGHRSGLLVGYFTAPGVVKAGPLPIHSHLFGNSSVPAVEDHRQIQLLGISLAAIRGVPGEPGQIGHILMEVHPLIVSVCADHTWVVDQMGKRSNLKAVLVQRRPFTPFFWQKYRLDYRRHHLISCRYLLQGRIDV